MKIMIELLDEEDKDPERVLNYFYEKCLDLYALKEIEKFEVKIEGTNLSKRK